jgi:large subunit ribosomal protein L20
MGPKSKLDPSRPRHAFRFRDSKSERRWAHRIEVKKMPRVKRGVPAAKRRKRILKRAKGFFGGRSKLHSVAVEAVEKADKYAYRDRRQRKREFRGLWIARINAAARQNGISYSRLMAGLKAAEIEIDRKVLAQLALEDPKSFTAIVEQAKQGAA